jgi:hypothetical protein
MVQRSSTLGMALDGQEKVRRTPPGYDFWHSQKIRVLKKVVSIDIFWTNIFWTSVVLS